VLALAVLPIGFASREVTLVQFIVLAQANLIASAFFAPIVIGLNWRRGGKAAALGSMFAGTFMCLLWTVTTPRPLGLEPIFAGVGASLAIYVLLAAFDGKAVRR
jgi:sodium/proline symporter